jgi:hypothetical protein
MREGAAVIILQDLLQIHTSSFVQSPSEDTVDSTRIWVVVAINMALVLGKKSLVFGRAVELAILDYLDL